MKPELMKALEKQLEEIPGPMQSQGWPTSPFLLDNYRAQVRATLCFFYEDNWGENYYEENIPK